MPAARWQENVTMAIPARAMKVERRPRIDPHLKTVAVFKPPLPTPHGLLLAFDAHVEHESFMAPRQPYVRERRLAIDRAHIQFGQIEQAI